MPELSRFLGIVELNRYAVVALCLFAFNFNFPLHLAVVHVEISDL